MKKLFSAATLIGFVASGAVILAPSTAVAAVPNATLDAACQSIDPTLAGMTGELTHSQTYDVYGTYKVTDARMTYGDKDCEVLYAEGAMPATVADTKVSYKWELYGDFVAGGTPQGNMVRESYVCEDAVNDMGQAVKCDLPTDGEVFVTSVHGASLVDGPFVWSDFTEVKWEFNVTGSDKTGVTVTPSAEDVAAAAATRDAAITKANTVANAEIKDAQADAAAQIKAVKKVTNKKIAKVKKAKMKPAAKKKAIKKLKKAQGVKIARINKAKTARIVKANATRSAQIKAANDAYTKATTPYEQVIPVNTALKVSRAV